MFPLPTWLSAKAIEVFVAFLSFALYTGVVYYQGGRGPRAEFDAYANNMKNAISNATGAMRIKVADSEAALRKLENENAENKSKSAAGWSAYNQLLKRPISSPTDSGKPVQITSKVCGDANSDQRLSNAIQKYRDDTLGAFKDYRLGVAGLLAVCESQAADLDELKAYSITNKSIFKVIP